MSDSWIPAGGVAFSGTSSPIFDDAKIGYDNNADADIDDPGDDIVWSEDFGSSSVTAYHDHAGNLIDDGVYRYVYDAWNRLVKVQSSADSGATTIQTAEFDATGRRLKKVVTDSGNWDGTVVYLYDGQKIIETRDGSGNMVQQVVRGVKYIDEIAMIRNAEIGDLYVHQDANWNVISLTDLGGSLVERYVNTPYGIMTVNQETGPGDYDGDGDVDSSDRAAGEVGGACRGADPSGACRVLDLDFDDDVDDADLTLCDSLPQGVATHPGRITTGVGQLFGHQGLLYEPEIGSYQNRARQYDPGKRRFVHRDPLALKARAKSGYQDGLNLYQYVAGNPGNRLDPRGLAIPPWALTDELYLEGTPMRGGGCNPRPVPRPPRPPCENKGPIITSSGTYSCDGWSIPSTEMFTGACECLDTCEDLPSISIDCMQARLGCCNGGSLFARATIRCDANCQGMGEWGGWTWPATTTPYLCVQNISQNAQRRIIVHEIAHTCWWFHDLPQVDFPYRDCLISCGIES